MGSIFFPLIVASFPQRWNIPTVQKLIYQFRYQHTKDVFLFIICYVAEYKTVFCSLIFWRFLFILPIASNRYTCQIEVFYKFLEIRSKYDSGGLYLWQNVTNDCMKMGWFPYMTSEISPEGRRYLVLHYSVTFTAHLQQVLGMKDLFET